MPPRTAPRTFPIPPTTAATKALSPSITHMVSAVCLACPLYLTPYKKPAAPASIVRTTKRPVGDALDSEADKTARDHRAGQNQQADVPRGRRLSPGADPARDRDRHPHAQGEDIRVREVDELQDAVDHRVPQRDQRVEAPDGEAIQECLQ